MIGLILYSTPFIAEELRAGIYGVKQGQNFAALALGLSDWQAMRYVVLPQALKIAMPPLLGQYMNIVKNSSLTMAIGVAELSYVSRQIESQSLQTFTALAWRQSFILPYRCDGSLGTMASAAPINKGTLT